MVQFPMSFRPAEQTSDAPTRGSPLSADWPPGSRPSPWWSWQSRTLPTSGNCDLLCVAAAGGDASRHGLRRRRAWRCGAKRTLRRWEPREWRRRRSQERHPSSGRWRTNSEQPRMISYCLLCDLHLKEDRQVFAFVIWSTLNRSLKSQQI